jgi:TolC family type I secretion outer membrane protein
MRHVFVGLLSGGTLLLGPAPVVLGQVAPVLQPRATGAFDDRIAGDTVAAQMAPSLDLLTLDLAGLDLPMAAIGNGPPQPLDEISFDAEETLAAIAPAADAPAPLTRSLAPLPAPDTIGTLELAVLAIDPVLALASAETEQAPRVERVVRALPEPTDVPALTAQPLTVDLAAVEAALLPAEALPVRVLAALPEPKDLPGLSAQPLPLDLAVLLVVEPEPAAGETPPADSAPATVQLADTQLANSQGAAPVPPPGMTVIRRSDPPSAAQTVTAPTPAGPVDTLADAILTALRENPDIQIAKARMDDARYGISESRAQWLPKLDLSVSGGSEFNNPNEGDTGFEIRREGTVSLRQLIWDFGVALNDIRRARSLYDAAEWSAREQIEAISFEIATAYIGVLERDRLVQLTRENIAAHERILRMVETQKELGLSTGADVSRVEARLNNVKASLLDRESARDQAREAYRRLVTRLPGQVVEPPSTSGILPATADLAVEQIDDSSPPLMQVLSERASLERQRASQFGNFFPKFEVEVQGNWKDDVSGPTGRNRDARAMLTMRYNVFNGGADVAIRRRLDARIREATFGVDRIRREVEQDVRNDFSALNAAQQKVNTINEEVAAAERVVELYREQFKTSKRTAFDLLDSQQNLFNARALQVTNEYQQVISSYRVLQKLGLLFNHVTGSEALPSD